MTNRSSRTQRTARGTSRTPRERSTPQPRGDRSSPSPEVIEQTTLTESQSDDWMGSGESARNMLDEQLAEMNKVQSARIKEPSRYYLDCDEGGSVIILDYKIIDMRSFYEHHIYHEGKYVGRPTLCPSKFDTCPACEGEVIGKPHNCYLGLFMSVIDTRKSKDAPHTFSRKLLVVKTKQQSNFFDVLEDAYKKHHTLHGVSLRMVRGREADSVSIGEITKVKLKTGVVDYRFVNEEKMKKYFSHEAVTDQSGGVIFPANTLTEPFDYADIFDKPSEDSVRLAYDLKPRHNAPTDETFDDGMFDGDDSGEMFGDLSDEDMLGNEGDIFSSGEDVFSDAGTTTPDDTPSEKDHIPF